MSYEKIQESALSRFFDILNEKELRYCVLRNYLQIPRVIRNDVDFLVDENHLCDIKLTALDTFKKFGFYKIRETNRLGYHGLYLIHKSSQNIILLDFFTKLSKRWYSYANEDFILDSRVKYKSFYVATAECWAVTVLIKDLLTYGELLSKNKHLIGKEYNNVAINSCLDGIFDDETKRNISLVLSGSSTFCCKDSLFKQLKKQSSKNFIRYLKSRVIDCYGNLTHAKNHFVVIIGPDGCGKTTISDCLINELKDKPFSNPIHIPKNVNILPNLKNIKYFFRSIWNRESTLNDLLNEQKEVDKSKEFAVNSGMNVEHSSNVTLTIYPLWYGFDYFLGRAKLKKWKSEYKLVIFARYFYDYYYQLGYRDYPGWILDIIGIIVPKPDLIFYLDRDAEEIYSKKPELSISEIKSQQDRILKKFGKHNNFKVIDAREGIELTVKKIKKEILGE